MPQPSLFPFLGVEIPNGDCVPRAVRWLDFVRISTIGPEEDHSIEYRFDVYNFVCPSLRKDAEQATNQL